MSIMDIHGEIEFSESMDFYMRKSYLFLLSGDLTPFGGKARAKKVIESIRIYQSTILAIAGNGEVS